MSFCLPYDCGLTLPREQRYTDWRFRRVCRYIHRLDQADAIELVAVLRIVEPKIARFGFHGKGAWRRDATKLLGELGHLSEPYYRANLEALTPETTVALSQALVDGGWKPRNPLPGVIRMGFMGFRERGENMWQIAKRFDYSYHTVTYGFRRPHAARRARAGVGLVI
jgi:hypothetical protein